jgi:hypothetical protein
MIVGVLTTTVERRFSYESSSYPFEGISCESNYSEALWNEGLDISMSVTLVTDLRSLFMIFSVMTSEKVGSTLIRICIVLFFIVSKEISWLTISALGLKTSSSGSRPG